jgi:fucose permease
MDPIWIKKAFNSLPFLYNSQIMVAFITERLKIPGHRNKLFLNISFFYAMFLFGINYGMIGPIVIELSAYTKTPLEAMGNFFALVASGYILGSLASSVLSRFRVRKKVFFTFYLLMPTSLVLLAFSFNYYLLLFAGFTMGIANGLLESNITVILAEINKGREAQYINNSQAMTSLGAFSGPLIATFFVGAGIHTRTFFLFIAFFSLINLLFFLFLKIPQTPLSSLPSNGLHKPFYAKLGSRGRPFLRKIMIVFALLIAMFFFVSTENGIGAWIPTFLRIEKNFSAVLAGNLISFFWLAGGIGRLITGYFTRKVRSSTILLFLSLASVMTFRIATLLEDKTAITVVLLFTGFFLASMWPMIVSLGVSFFPSKSAVFLPLVIMTGGLGGIFSPWAIGLAYGRYDLNVGIDLIFFLSLILLLMIVILFFCDLRYFKDRK